MTKTEYIIAELKDQYTQDDNNRPWVVGFSGGKDSTVLLQLVWVAIKELSKKERKRNIFVVCNDTLVENPLIVHYVENVLEKIEKSAVKQDLPIKVKKTIPKLQDSFWLKVLGLGYPVPNNKFRWCTDRMKIKPTSHFIAEQVSENGKAIILIGTRKSESITRARAMKKREIRGRRLTRHPHEKNTYVYAPIKDLELEEVWGIINGMPSPWGGDNSELFKIYSDASSDDYECPTMVTDKKHTSCGQSRFGCWTCTVVKEDKSMTSLIENGYEWLSPLLKLRNEMVKERNVSANRETTRRNGKKAVTVDGVNQGNYTERYRAELLEKLLKTQKKIQKSKKTLQLINQQELIAIQVIWQRDLNFNYSVGGIYDKIYNNGENNMLNSEAKQKEESLLKEVCHDEVKNYKLIQELLQVQKSKELLKRKRGLISEIEKTIKRYLE